jgi:hypothetical protein
LSADKTYSPTVNNLTFATILQIAIIFNLKRRTIDVVGAYLYQDFPLHDREPLYLKLEKLVAEACDLDPEQIYQVKKFIYGLPDAGRAYYDAYSSHLIKHGYQKSFMDPCLFFKVDELETTFILIHVDDTFVCSNNLENIERLTSILRTKFEITINDAADEYLGIHLKQLKDGSIQMIHPKILKNLFEEYHEHIQLYNRKSTIITSPFKRHNNNNNNNNSNNTNNYQQSENQSIDSKKYLHLLGTKLSN